MKETDKFVTRAELAEVLTAIEERDAEYDGYPLSILATYQPEYHRLNFRGLELRHIAETTANLSADAIQWALSWKRRERARQKIASIVQGLLEAPAANPAGDVPEAKTSRLGALLGKPKSE